MAIADGGELIVLAPGVAKFGEDAKCDELIRACVRVPPERNAGDTCMARGAERLPTASALRRPSRGRARRGADGVSGARVFLCRQVRLPHDGPSAAVRERCNDPRASPSAVPAPHVAPPTNKSGTLRFVRTWISCKRPAWRALSRRGMGARLHAAGWQNEELRGNKSAAAHMIHGSSEDRCGPALWVPTWVLRVLTWVLRVLTWVLVC